MGSFKLAAAILAFALAASQSATAAERLPIPSEADQSAALPQVKELYAAEYQGQSVAARLALAEKLLKSAGETEDPTLRYVLWSEARDVAGAVGNARVALAAADRLAATYAHRPAEATLAALDALRRSSSISAAAAGDAVMAALIALDGALANANLDVAVKLMTSADAFAALAANRDLAIVAKQISIEVHDANSDWARLMPQRTVLQDKPDDPKASLAVGKFLSLTLGRWGEGLALLANASDPKLKELAALDRSAPADPKLAVTIADGWLALADGARGLQRAHLLRRALEWDRRALPGLTGLNKLRIAKRIAASASIIRPWDPTPYETSADSKGVELPFNDSGAMKSCLIQFDLKTLHHGSAACLVTKRKREGESSVTVLLTDAGAISAAGDGSFYKEEVIGKKIVNDGNWHTVRIEKEGKILRLFVDGVSEGKLDVRPDLSSPSPWTLGWHGVWNSGSLDAEFRHVRIETVK
jgi:hypothetical protein